MLIISLITLTCVSLEPAWPSAFGSAKSSLSQTLLHQTGLFIELFGIGVMLVGALWATGVFVKSTLEKEPFQDNFHQYRSNIGRAILLGLEFLVLADIVGTVAVEPTFRNLGVLGVIIGLRTFLSFALEVEINGRWPWQAVPSTASFTGDE